MNNISPLETLPAQDLENVLSMNWDQLTDTQTQEVEDFIIRIGGIENATLAVKHLRELESA